MGGTRLRKDSGAQLRGEDPGFLSDVKRFSNIAIGALTRGWMDGFSTDIRNLINICCTSTASCKHQLLHSSK